MHAHGNWLKLTLLLAPLIYFDCALTQYCAAPSGGAADALIDDLSATLHAAKCALTDAAQWPPDAALEATNIAELQDMYFDYVVVGGGTAGSIVASRLSEHANVTVLLLEAGDVPPIESEMYSLSGLLHRNTQWTWPEHAVPHARCCRAMKTGACYWPHGKMLGGTGALNGNIFLRGSMANFERWAQLGNTGWSWQDVEGVYVEMLRAQKGHLVLNYFNATSVQNKLSALIFNASDELGVPRAEDLLFGPTAFGYSADIPATIADGRRASTARSYLGSGVTAKRINLKVMRNVLASRVLLNAERRAVAVNYTLHGRELRVWARHEIILAAGAINTPKLLMLSGIGPRRHLQSVGVPVQVDLPVGENLHDHGMMPLLLKFTGNNTEEWINFNGENDHAQNILDYFLEQRGDLASGYSLMGFINSTQPESTQKGTQPDLHLVSHTVLPRGSSGSFSYLGFRDELVTELTKHLRTHNVLQIMGSLLLPQSRGRVRLRSANTTDPPLIYNYYAAAPADRAVLLRFVRYVQRMLQTEAFRAQKLQLLQFSLPNCDTRFDYDTDEYWYCYMEHFYISAWHAVGTCRMAPKNEARAVVDPRLRVRHVTGLRVIDASIMPEITAGNTNGPTALIAEMGARMIQQDYQKFMRETSNKNEANFMW